MPWARSWGRSAAYPRFRELAGGSSGPQSWKTKRTPSVRGRYAALHREQSARYLAVVEARIGREPVSTVLAAVIALLSAFVILVMMAWNGGNPHVWPETLPTVIPFAITYGFFLWMVLDQSSSRSRTFVRAYRAHVGPENTEAPAPEERLYKPHPEARRQSRLPPSARGRDRGWDT